MRRLRSKNSRIIGIVSTVIFCALFAIGIYAYASQVVEIEVSQMPNVDIILTRSQTQVDLTEFDKRLKEELVAQGVMSQSEIDSGKVNISAIDTQTIETQEVLRWNESVSTSVGSVSFGNDGKDVVMVGNRTNAGKNAIWIIPEGNQKQTFHFGYDIDYGDSFNAAGMLLRVRENADGTLEGYMLSFNNRGAFATGANGSLWHFKYDKVNSVAFRQNTDITLISNITIAKSGNLNVYVDDTCIKVSGGGLAEEYTYTFPAGETYGDGYGFFSDHYSHNCDKKGHFNLTNINLQVETVKKFTEVLQAPDWRDGSLRILVDVEDNENEQFANEDELTAIIAKLMNSDVYYIGWGTDTNKGQMENVINKNDSKGTFIANTSEEAIQATVEYISQIIKPNVSNVIIAGESVNVKITSPSSGEVETPTDAFPNGVWRVVHDDKYYQNPQNQYELNNMYTNELIQEFDNVGKYTIYCEDRPVIEVFAHRRPVASFNMSVAGNQVTLKSTSYDLDIEANTENTAEQQANNGIKIEKWEYKNAKDDNAEWVTIESNAVGKEISQVLDENTEYMIRLTITDYQGVESTATKYITTGEATLKPIASFKVTNKTISMYDKLEVIDESYDPSGMALTYEWTVNKDGETVYTGTEPLLDFSTTNNSKYGIGTYEIQLIVSKNIEGSTIKSDAFKQTIQVVKDITPPVIIIDPTAYESQNQEININANIRDQESGLKSYQYAFTGSIDKVEDEWSEPIAISGNEDNVVITLPEDRLDEVLYLHVKATNQDDTTSEEKVTGPYYINPYKLELQIVDSDTGVGIKDATYNIIGEKENGQTVEILTEGTTDGDGKIYVEKAKLKDITRVRVENVSAATGYEISEDKTVKIDTSTSKVVIDQSETSPDIQADTEEDGELLKIRVPVERIKFDLQITNIDSQTNNYISGTEFILKQDGNEIARGTTVDGILTFTVPIGGLNTTKEYVLEQTYVGEQYNGIGTTYLRIEFDENGQVKKVSQRLFAGNDNVTIPDETKAEIIVKNDLKDLPHFGVNIHVTDSSNGSNLANSVYKIKVEGENNLNYSTSEVASDENGNIQMDDLYGVGLLRLTFIHANAPAGYGIESVDRYITINVDVNGNITYNEASMAGVFDRIVGERVFVNLTNTRKASTNAVKINIMSAENTNVGLDGINVYLYRVLDDALIASGTTDENGYLEIQNIKNDGVGQVIYKVETENNVLGITPIIVIDFENGRITNAYQLSTLDNVNVNYSEDDDEDYYKYVANIQINGTLEAIYGENNLVITQEDRETGNRISGTQYKIKMTSDSSLHTEVLNTNENGQIMTPLLSEKNLTIQITQTKAAVGYKLDNRTKTIILSRDSNGTYRINSLNNIEGSQVTIDDHGNVLVSEKGDSNKNSSVSLQLATTDLNNTLNLGGFKFKVTEPTTGFEEEITTNSNGYVLLNNDFIATEGKSYVLEIQETEAVAPYQVISEPIKIELRFSKEGEIVKYNGISYLQGNNYLANKAASYDSENNNVTVSLKIMNSIDPNLLSGILYDIDIIKVNKNGEKVSGSRYDIEVRPYAESSIVSRNKTIDDEIEVSNLAIRQDKTTILLKETNAAIGYGLDDQIKVVTLRIDENGNLVYLDDTTSKDLTVEIKTKEIDGITKKVVEVTITAKDPSEEEQPSTPGNPGEEYPEVPDAEDRPEDATVAFKVFNKSYGSWTKTYTIRDRYRHYGHYHYYNVTASYQLDSAQKLERIFKDTAEAQQYGFNFITGADITLEARLVTDGVVSEEIYETSESKGNTNVNDTNGTDSIYLFKDYANKQVEFTVIQNVPAYNYKRNTTDVKFIVQFDSYGKIQSGTITQGNDTEDFAIGGLSAQGIVDNIQYLSYAERNRYTYSYGAQYNQQYTTGDILDYNCIGQDTISFGLLNKAYSNPLEITVNLQDADTNDGLTGEVSAIVMEKVGEEEYRALSTNSITIENGVGSITLDTTYANRTLRIELLQTSNGRRGNVEYINTANISNQFELDFDDDANIKEHRQLTIPNNAECEAATNNKVEYTIYNDIKYNFAINVQKLDENGDPLAGVRIQTDTTYVTEPSTGAGTKVFTYGSRKTDENGNVKLKIVLPETGSYRYFGATMDITLTEYYVPDNYKAKDGIKLRVLFNNAGMVSDVQVLSDYAEGNTTITGINEVEEGVMENSSFNITLQNEQVEEKPVMQITDMDSEDNTVKLQGTKYKITVWDENEYTENDLQINETRYSTATNEEGITSIYFENAHALRTMVYRIEEVESAKSYTKNNDIIIRVVYDKEGRIASTPQILTEQYINVPNRGNVSTVSIDGNPIGSTLLKLNIINELDPVFTIRVNKSEAQARQIYNGNIFKATSQVRSSAGVYQDIEEERLSKAMLTNSTEIGFKKAHPGETVLYTIYEQTGDEYTERGKVEVTFDEYGNVINQSTSGKYITNTSFSRNTNYINVNIGVEQFRLNIQMESSDKEANYSLAGYSFDIVNNKGEHSNVNTKTNSLGNVVEIIGEVYKGETVTYNISQVTNAIDYEPTKGIELTVVFDENGNITSCTPTSEAGVYDLITTVKDTNKGINMQIKMYVVPSERSNVDITVQDDRNEERLVQEVMYEVSVGNDNTKYDLIAYEGNGVADIGSNQKYKNQTVMLTLKQTSVADNYMINDSDIQISVTYDGEGHITDARIIASDGYVRINQEESLGTSSLKLETNNRRKTVMQVQNISSARETDKLAGASFKIIQKDKSELYGDTKSTNSDGMAELYVGPYYRGEEITYKITNTTPAFGFKKMEDAEFTLTYDEDGEVIDTHVAEALQEYLNVEIANGTNSEGGPLDVIITIKSEPLFTVGVEALDENTSQPLVGGKYEVVQANNSANKGTVITQDDNIAHASVGETEPGQTITYQIIERGAPVGYKYKNKDQVIGRLQVAYDGEGHIISSSPTLLSGYEYFTIKDSTDKPSDYDVDLQITYEEIEELNIIIENENILDNSDKIQSKFSGQLTTGITAETVTDPETGLGTLAFGKVTSVNSRQTLTISQSEIQGSFGAIANIRLSINFDESGKIKDASGVNGAAYATVGEAYTIDQIGDYIIKITVRNNPVTKFNITNVSDGNSELAVNGTYEITGTGINGTATLELENGQASVILDAAPKNRRVNYILRQTKVDRGYTLNDNIILTVNFDNDGKITNAYQTVNSSSADNSVINSIQYDNYQVDLEINNKQKFEVYIDTVDKYNDNIKLPYMNVSIKEETYSDQTVNIRTDSNGSAVTDLGSTVANSYLDYEIRVLNVPSGYNSRISTTYYNVRVYFESNGNISKCESSSDLIEVSYGSGLAVEIKVKYEPLLDMEIIRTNTSTNTPLAGRTITVSSSAMYRGYVRGTTNAQGRLQVDGGTINGSNTVTYTISEQALSTDTNFENLPTLTMNVTYDDLGKIANVTVSDDRYLSVNIVGDRSLDVYIGSQKVTTAAITTADYYNHTLVLSANYEITSDKGEKVSISSTTGFNNIIAELGKVYAGEKITYTIHQTNAQAGYETVEDQTFTIKYNLDGTIGEVVSNNPDRLVIQKVNQNNSRTQPNIMLQIYSKSTLEIQLKVKDKIYGTGVNGLGFKVKNEETGRETITNATTDDNGILNIQVPPTYENKTVTYTVSQVQTYGGYKEIPSFQIVVAYGNLGTIIENQTYIINQNDIELTQGYSENLYKNSRRKGIQVVIKAETQMGIGIEKTDIYGNKLNGIEYIITAKEDQNTQNWRVVTDANGEVTNYIGDMPKSKVIEYTISELQAPAGFRKVEDIVLKVYYNSEGRINSYSIENQPENVTIEIATDNLLSMSNSKEKVHLKLKITNDDRFTFKVVNKDSGNGQFIVGSKFQVTIEGEEGTILSNNIETNKKGEATIANIEGSGNITVYFNQTDVPSNYSKNPNNSGFIEINKNAQQYKLTYLNSSSNLSYTIDNETGIITIYLTNDNNLVLNIADIDSETGTPVLNGSHAIKAQYGELSESPETILRKTDNIIWEKGPYITDNSTIQTDLGNTYQVFNKKVIFTISTPITPDKGGNEKYNSISDVYIAAEFDENGLLSKVEGLSSRVETVENTNSLTINTVIGFGNIDNYKIKIVKETEENGTRINGAVFDVDFKSNDDDIQQTYTSLETGIKIINGISIEEGVTELPKLKTEGKITLTVTETKAPDGYEGLVNVPMEINFDLSLNKISDDNVTLQVTNLTTSSQSLQVETNETTREITINIINKPVINLNITKTDENGNNLAGMSFNITIQEKDNLGTATDYGTVTTGEEGNIASIIPMDYKNKTIFITLTESKNEFYQEIAPITIEAETDESGHISSAKLISGSTAATLSQVTETGISLSVVNELNENAKPYEIKIIKTNENDDNLRIANVIFQVKVTPNVGVPVYKAVATDENGEINLEGLIGSGKIMIELRELEAPAGYELGETDGYYQYEIQKENDILQEISSNVEEDLMNIDNDNKIINIKVPNRAQTVGLAINKVDENDLTLNIPNAKFKLRETSTGEETFATTDSKGIAYFSIPNRISQTVSYTLTEVEAASGYELDSTERNISITFDQDGKISLPAEIDGLELTEKSDKYAKYMITNKQSSIGVNPYALKVVNIDNENRDSIIPNAEFNIKIKQTIGATSLETTRRTDANGAITISQINGAGDITIDIKNTAAGEGYQINNDFMQVKMHRNENTGNITIEEANNINAEYDESNNLVIIYISSRTEVNKYSLVVNVVDQNTNEPIENSNAKFDINIAGENKKVEVNENGQAIIQGLTIPDVANFEISFEETQAPNGYEQVSDIQKIRANVTTVYDSRVIQNIEILEGEQIRVLATGTSEITINILHNSRETSGDELYLTSDIYRVTEENVERVSNSTTVADFLDNMKSNGEMKVLDSEGNIVSEERYVGTGMTIIATKGNESISKTISVVGDVTGDGEIKALDISIMKQYLIGKRDLVGVYLLAGDITDDGEIKALDVSKEKQAIIGKINL